MYKISLFFLKLSSLKIIYIIVKCHHSHYPAISWRIWIFLYISLQWVSPLELTDHMFLCPLPTFFFFLQSVSTFSYHLSCPNFSFSLEPQWMSPGKQHSEPPLFQPESCCGGTLRELSINECLQASMNWSHTVKKNGLKFLHDNVRY